MALSDKQILFCELYVTYGNATKAAKQAGYSENNPGQVGHELLKNEEVKQYIADRRKAIIENHGVTRDRIISELAKVAFFNVKELFNDDDTQKAMSDITLDTAAAISVIKFGTAKDLSGNNVTVVEEYKTGNKIDANVALARMIGGYGPDDPTKKKVILTIDEIEVVDHNPQMNEKPEYEDQKPPADADH